jgi:uncharacterized protein (DUF885 family)
MEGVLSMKFPVTVLTVVLAGTIAVAQRDQTGRTLDDFFNDFTTQWVRSNPDQATATRYFTGAEQDRLEQQLAPATDAYLRARIELARKGLGELKKFDPAGLTEQQRVSVELAQWQLQTVVDQEPYLDFVFPLEQMNGVNVRVVEALTVRHPLLTDKDAVNYVAALGQVSTRMEEAIAETRRRADKGILPPRFILQATVRQMRSFTEPAANQNPFVMVFAQKIDGIQSMPEPRRQMLRAQAERVVAGQIYPAWNKGVELLESQIARATDEPGVWRFKGGSDAYAYALRRFTTTNMTPEQVHQIGLREVARIESEMDAIFRRLGRSEGPLQARIDTLKKDLAYPLTEQGRELIMADVNQILRDAQKRSEALFDTVPRSPVVAQPFPRFREANAAANYNSPALDGSRPGTFQIPLRPERMTKYGLRSLVYHETVPGHHFQIALQVENQSLPRFRQLGVFLGISALVEGWGLYAERLAAESGWYDGDLEGRLGQLDAELFRARRLVVDTGLHAMHWTRQQAIAYGIEASEVDRYVVNPGQACSYMIGQLKLVELREKGRTALGEKFSLREYHSVVLNTGTVPLDLLERQVNAWIRVKGGKI